MEIKGTHPTHFQRRKITEIPIKNDMKKVIKESPMILTMILICFILWGCNNYHKLDFYASNQGFSYLDSLKKENRCVALPYPRDAFYVAKPFLIKRYGRKSFRERKPYHVMLVNDSTWEVWTDGDFCRKLDKNDRYTVGWSGVGISMLNGRILYLKHNR